MNDDRTSVVRPVLIGLVALVAASALIGGVVSVLALGFADVTGLRGDASSSRATAAQTSLFIPRLSATATPSKSSDPEPQTKPAKPPSVEPPKTPRPSTRRQISLVASPSVVSTFERINLTGTYRGVASATLQVQRFEAGWADFPTTASVANGTFATYVETGVSGQNRFRVIDDASGRSSKPVTVTVQ